MGAEEAWTNPLLQRVADALGLPVENLFTETALGISDGTAECLRLWHQLTSDEQRQQALDALRALASETDLPA